MPTNPPKTQAPRRFPARRALAMIATIVAWCALAVENGAQQIETGWAISGPAPALPGPTPAELRQQMILDNIFFVNTTILKKPPALPVPTAQSEKKTSSLRFAPRPNGDDGWRPASQGEKAGDRHPPLSQLFPSDSTTTVRFPDAPASEAAMPHENPPAPSLPFPPGAREVVSRGGITPRGEEAADAIEDYEDYRDEETDSQVIIDDSPSDEEIREESEWSDDEESTEEPAISPPEQRPLPPLTRQLTNLRSRVRGVLNGYYRKPLNSSDHNPWEVMHGMLAYEVQSRIRQGGPRGELITSVGWLCYNKPCNGQTLLHITRDGRLRAKYGVGLQGHLGQLLAMLAQCKVSPDYPIMVGNNRFTIRDLIEAEKETCYSDSELTFKLLAFQHYLDLDEVWLNDQGEVWDFPRLIREELAQPVRGAACGATHRLSALSLTVNARLRRGEPLDGEYALAADYVRKHHQYAFQLQNRDGSLSTSWFRGRGDESDKDRRMQTTGHILEWLCYSLSDEQLRHQRMIRAVSYLANLMYSNYNHEWEVGPVSHATHALLVYDERVFQPYDRPEIAVSYRPRRSEARRPQPNTTRR